MSPEWRRILSRHKEKTLGELCRRPKIHEQIAGFIVDYSHSLILLHRLDWNTFTLDGYTVLRDEDINANRFFSRSTYWQAKAVKQLRLKPKRPAGIVLNSLSEAITSISRKFPLIHVECEIAYPDECYIGVPLELKKNELVLDCLNADGEWSGSWHSKLNRITRIDFGGGYERALAATAPPLIRPPGYFKDVYTKAETKELNRLAKFSPQRIVR